MSTPADLLTHLDAAGLSKYDMPEYFLRLDEIPLTPNGKMLKRAIVDWIAARPRHAPAGPFRGQAAQLTQVGARPYETRRFATASQIKRNAARHVI